MMTKKRTKVFLISAIMLILSSLCYAQSTEKPVIPDSLLQQTQTTQPTQTTRPTQPAKPTQPTQPKEVSVTGVTLNNTPLNLNVNGTYTLVATVQPDNATNKKIEWSSNNPAIVSVDANGNVIAKAAGRAVITATSAANPNAVARCTVSIR